MAKLTMNTLEYVPISYSQSQARKARHTILACKAKSGKLSQHAKCRQAYRSMHSKSEMYIRGCKSPEWQTGRDKKIVVEIRKAQHKETGRAMTSAF